MIRYALFEFLSSTREEALISVPIVFIGLLIYGITCDLLLILSAEGTLLMASGFPWFPKLIFLSDSLTKNYY